MKIFTNDEIRTIDHYTIEKEGVKPIELIQRVASAAVGEITRRWRQSKPVVVFAGPGNNGADALAIASQLGQLDYRVQVYLFNIGGNKLSQECSVCRDRMLAEAPSVSLTEVVDTFMLPELPRTLLIIDGLFGSGLREGLTGGFAALVQHINEARATVVSIDIPSGLGGDWNPKLISRDVVHASLTLAIEHPRLAFFIPGNAELVGEWLLLDIGLSEKAAAEIPARYYLVEEADVERALRRRRPFTTKADYGNAIIYAGSFGMMGAAALAARGALRSGVGKLTVEAPACGYHVLQTLVPESLYSQNPGKEVIETIHPEHSYDAVAVGPGIGTRDVTVRALEEFLSATKNPVVLDADALNCIARKPSMLDHIPVLSILTPHQGEFDRLFGTHHCGEERLMKAVDVARKYNILIILKGYYTAIVRPDGKIYFNSSGTPALATPGSGDVLTGVITSLLAQRYKPEIASLLAVYLHGMAGQLAEEQYSQYGVMASDIADCVGRAIHQLIDPPTPRV